MRLLSIVALSSVVGLLAGCAAEVPENGEGDVESSEEAVTAGPPTVLESTDAKETRLRAGGLSVWVETVAKTKRVGSDAFVTVRFRTSRSLESAMSWVPEDGFGDARLVSPRVVEVDLRNGHEVNSILSGMPLFVHLRAQTGAVKDYDVRLDLGARLSRFSGSSRVYVDAPITPVYYADGPTKVRYRGIVRSPGSTAMGTKVGGQHANLLFPLGGGKFRFDYDYTRFSGGLGVEGAASFTATHQGNPYTKTSSIDVVVTRAGLTKEGAEQVWPTLVCAAAVKACIEAQPASTKDFGPCGSYREVQRCMIEE